MDNRAAGSRSRPRIVALSAGVFRPSSTRMSPGKGGFGTGFCKYQKLPSRFQEEIGKKATLAMATVSTDYYKDANGYGLAIAAKGPGDSSGEFFPRARFRVQ
jgi:hypothetical protein